eukprot:TRINITY_DN3480_c0_g1_i1.p1 TRINITY_DN3480_c0_g1~~TRINITY_DN3480_c0_g1_i1.p1  ORF type:complete len:450 (+),score=119.97 TRINITY_DN3480_c0_g1_i1:547-1896(+)
MSSVPQMKHVYILHKGDTEQDSVIQQKINAMLRRSTFTLPESYSQSQSSTPSTPSTPTNQPIVGMTTPPAVNAQSQDQSDVTNHSVIVDTTDTEVQVESEPAHSTESVEPKTESSTVAVAGIYDNTARYSFVVAVLHALFQIVPFRQALLECETTLPDDYENVQSCAVAIQHAFVRLSQGKNVDLRTVTRSFGWSESDAPLNPSLGDMRELLIQTLSGWTGCESIEGVCDLFMRSQFHEQITLMDDMTGQGAIEQDVSLEEIDLPVEGLSSISESFGTLLEPRHTQFQDDNGMPREAFQMMQLTMLPKVLTLYLQRLLVDRMTNGLVKETSMFSYGVDLDLTWMLFDDTQLPPEYELIGVTSHSGPAEQSIYTYYGIGIDGKWHRYGSDGNVTESTVDHVTIGLYGMGGDDQQEVAIQLVYCRKDAREEVLNNAPELPSRLEEGFASWP